MKRKILYALIIAICFGFGNAFSQNKFPEFKTAPFEIRFPASMTGLMKDPANKVNNEFVYKLDEQLFTGTDGHIQTKDEGFNGKTKMSTPFETLTELTAAQMAKDFKAIEKLYTKSSQSDLNKMTEGDNMQKYLDYVGTIKGADVVCGFNYREGYVAIVDIKGIGLSASYFVKEGKKYFVSSIKEAGATVWNVSNYFKFKPEPPSQPTLTNPFDSMPEGGSQRITFKLNKAGNFVNIFKGNLGGGVMISAQDGTPADSNETAGMVDVTLSHSHQSDDREYTFYYVETNYPVTMVSEGLMNQAGTIKFKLYTKK